MSTRPSSEFFARRFGQYANGLLGSLTILATCLILAYVVGDARTRPLVTNTILWAGGAASLSLPIGALLAIYVQRTQLPYRKLVAGTTMLMLFLPAYLQLASWEAGFGLQGWFCRWMFPDRPIAILDGWRGALWTQALLNLPWVVLIVRLGLATVPQHAESQAALDGRSWRVLRFVTLPAIRWALVAAWLWTFVLAAGDITVTDVYQIRTFAEELYTGFALGDDLQSAPLRNLPGMILILGIGMAALIACRDFTRRSLAMTEHNRWVLPVESRRRALFCGLMVGACMLGWIGVPCLNLLFQAGLEVRAVDDARIRHWSAQKTATILMATPMRFAQEFGWSFALAQLTAISVSVSALTLAWKARTSRIAASVGWAATLIGLAVPGPIVALSIARGLNFADAPWLAYLCDRTLFLPWLSLLLHTFPFAFLVAHWAARRVDEQLIEIVRVHGANRRQLFRFVTVPQLARPFGWLWVLVMAFSVADLSSTVLAVPPGVTTISIRIFNLVHYGVSDQLAGLCLTTMLLFAAITATFVSILPEQD